MIAPELLARLARGVNVSRWFRYPAENSERHYRGFITDADLDLLVAMGVTAVRLAADPRYLQLAYLDEAVARIIDRGLVVVLDYHDESRAIETGPAAEAALERTWISLAEHYKRTPPDRILLEIFNEPVFDRNPAAWFPLRRRLASAIRSAAPLHTIVAGGPNWSSLDGLLGSKPLDDDNVLYTFHFYEPFEFTHQGAPWVQGPVRLMRNVCYPSSPQQARHVDCRIASAADWARRHNVPVWAGEFGAYPPHAPKNDRLRWLYDVRTALERHGIGWAVWSYDESLGLDRTVDPTGSVRVDWDSAAALGLRAPGAVA
jgi:aryl-phospho-beta-D-glucosidase BglC (GH1 family)